MKSCRYKEVFEEVLEEQFSWKIFFRQLFVSSGMWTLFFTSGLYLGAPTVIIPAMRREANSTDAVSVAMASLISSGCSYGTIPWNFMLPVLLATIGRKLTSIFINLALVIVSVVFYFSETPTQLLTFEVLNGLPHSGTVTVAVMVIAEYTSPKYRGMFLMTKSASMHWGIWASNVIGTFFHWRYISAVGFFCSLYTLTVVFWPESSFCLTSKKRFNDCRKSHRWLKGNGDASKRELENLLNYQREQNGEIRKFEHHYEFL